MIDADIFNDVPLFSLFDADERQVLAQQVSMREFKKDEIIFNVGDPGRCAYLVQRGKVDVSITDLVHLSKGGSEDDAKRVGGDFG